MTDYRLRIYPQYGSRFQGAGTDFNSVLSGRWGRAYDWYLRSWLPEDKQANILDVACGNGSLLHFFRQRGYSKLTGVDISPEQVALAGQVIPDVHQANVLDFLESHCGEFDLITGLDLIEHFQKDEVLRFLDGCYHSLKTGGRLILQTPNAETPWAGYHRYNDLTHEICFQHNSISCLLRLCGFGAVEVREQGPVPYGYSLKSTIRWLMWQLIRSGLKAYNLAETGSTGSGVYTRVFITGAIKEKGSKDGQTGKE